MNGKFSRFHKVCFELKSCSCNGTYKFQRNSFLGLTHASSIGMAVLFNSILGTPNRESEIARNFFKATVFELHAVRKSCVCL